jgi:hypothetical protein
VCPGKFAEPLKNTALAFVVRAIQREWRVLARFSVRSVGRRGYFFRGWRLSEKLTPAARPALKRLLDDLENHRHPLATDTRHSLYRLQPERWLESIVLKDVGRIEPALDSRFVYTQVFASGCSQHGILDVLTVTRTGPLAILELKAAEHIHLPLQAADYWLRIKRHLEQCDLGRYGYFSDTELQSVPPLVYLIAPALRSHPSTDALLRYLSPEMEITRVGLTESWRRGLQGVCVSSLSRSQTKCHTLVSRD